MDTITPGNISSGSSNQKQHLALRVALDTMKDRCILQQKRLSEVEEENQQLRERMTQKTKPTNTSHNAGGVAENFQLRLQVSELQRQNAQLNAHINMVSVENRKLWSRLSQMAKDQTTTTKDNDSTLTNNSSGGCGVDEENSPRAGGSINQNLIRSKTFTQHSPNPNLRLKLISADNCDSSDMLDVSLENDVALEVFGDDGTRHQQHAGGDSDGTVGQVAMGFGYLNVDDSSSNATTQEHDFNAETKKCIEGFHDIRREAMRQQQELTSVFALLESRIALQPCPECVKKSHKPEMADKSLETDESFNDGKYAITRNDLNNLSEPTEVTTDTSTPIQTNNLNIIQEKILADDTNKMCPMCGKIYDYQVTFESFCEHVEDHFRDDNIDLDHSMENNFELVSHTVGDF